MKRFGPGVVIAAAFIGPGTLTASTLAGVHFGFSLLWAMLFSILGTMVLQEMAARLGMVSQMGLAHAVRSTLPKRSIRLVITLLVLSAVFIGNTAYEAGNLSGAVLGLEVFLGAEYRKTYALFAGLLVFLLLWFGNYRFLEKVFVGLIAIMSVSFVVTAVLTKPDIQKLITGLFLPTLPAKSALSVIAIVGTTIVPYNLFLHTALVKEKWGNTVNLKALRFDTLFSIGLGGLVSLSIIITAAAVTSTDIKDAIGLAKGLEPLMGQWAQYFVGMGLFAAGITSAITAPLAAAYVVKNCMGWDCDLLDRRFRGIWIAVLLVGLVTLLFDMRPIQVITFAQIANGLLLPLIAIMLVWMVNNTALMGNHRNTRLQNFFGLVVIVICIILGAKSIITVITTF
ncbi:MAG: Nramp family divalent metal transporter [Bacteroidota bacterium]